MTDTETFEAGIEGTPPEVSALALAACHALASDEANDAADELAAACGAIWLHIGYLEEYAGPEPPTIEHQTIMLLRRTWRAASAALDTLEGMRAQAIRAAAPATTTVLQAKRAEYDAN